MKVPNNKPDLDQQDHRDATAAHSREPIDPSAFLGTDIEKHNDEKEKHHYGACIDQHLNDADEKRVKRHKQRGKAEERNNQAKRARNRVPVEDDSHPENHGERCKNPKQKWG